MDAAGRLYLSRMAAKRGTGRVCFVEGVGPPKDDGRYVSIDLEVILPGGASERVTLLFTTDRFYEDLETVLETALPKLAGKRVN